MDRCPVVAGMTLRGGQSYSHIAPTSSMVATAKTKRLHSGYRSWQYVTGAAHDASNSRMVCEHLEPRFTPTVRASYHGTTYRGPGLCRHHTGPLPERRIILDHPGLDPLAKGMCHRGHPFGERRHGLLVRDIRPRHQQRMQRCPLIGRLQVAGEAIVRVPRWQMSDSPRRRTETVSPRRGAYTALLQSCIGSYMI